MKQQLSIFDDIKPPAQNHDPAILNFTEDIDGKKMLIELNNWRYKHRNRINDLPEQQRLEVLNHLENKIKEIQ